MVKKVNYEAFRLAAAAATDKFQEFAAPYATYHKRKNLGTEKCDICLKKALSKLRELEEAAGVVIVKDNISWRQMADVCDEIDYEATRLAAARKAAK